MLARSCAKVPGENAARMSAHARTPSNELEYMPRVRRRLVVRKVEALRTIKGIAIPLATTTIRHFNTTKHTNAMRIWTYYLREQRFWESRAGPNDSIPRPRKIRAQLQIRPERFQRYKTAAATDCPTEKRVDCPKQRAGWFFRQERFNCG